MVDLVDEYAVQQLKKSTGKVEIDDQRGLWTSAMKMRRKSLRS